MNKMTNIDPEDLALYAMQLLTPEEMAAISLHLEHNPVARQEFAELQGGLAALAFTSEMQAPSAMARSSFLKKVAREPRAMPPLVEEFANAPVQNVTSIGAYQRSSDEKPSMFAVEAAPRSSVARFLPWAGWAIAAGLALTAGNLYRQREDLRGMVATDQVMTAKISSDASAAREILNAMNDQTAMRVTLTQKGATLPPAGRTTYSADRGVLIFTATNMEPIDTYKVYELWLIPADGKDPIPAGTFHPDAHGYASMISTEMPKGIEAKAFGITIEDSGGAKTPTPPILMTGA